MKQLLFEHVQVGQQIPALEFDITTTGIIAGAMASRDYSPLHHDREYAVCQAGHRDVFLNTPQQAAFFERYLSDWSGPKGRLGRMRLVMRTPVYAGDRIIIAGTVSEKKIDGTDCGWVSLMLNLSVKDETNTECEARYALPLTIEDNPWPRDGRAWQP